MGQGVVGKYPLNKILGALNIKTALV